ncbi:MAG: energy transducer TonB [Bacteroidetes bacterium]|nr:energy transducer TonB [Bacteroidota bacterium]
MNTKNFSISWNDVVFENRNKEYGAYFIRSAYGNNVSKASTICVLFFGLLLIVVQWPLTSIPETHKRIVDPPLPFLFKKIKISTDHVRPQEAVKHKLNTKVIPTKVVTHEVAEPKPITTEEPGPIESGKSNELEILSDGSTINLPATPTIELQKTFDHAEVMPEFEGGLKALYKFLNRHLRYPAVARHQGQEGTVLVRFVVDATGTVTNIEIIRGVSGAIDHEATRVVALLPKWKPGRQHDSPVNVRMVIPIKFKLGD